jgi:TPR repeat protein
MYEHGRYFRRNITKAMSHYYNACEMNEASGCKNLAYLKEKKGNTISAKQLYKKACILGDNYSCNRLESVLGSYIYEIKDIAGLNESTEVCNNSSLGGTMCYRVGLYYEKNDEVDKARSYFEKACRRKQSQSCKHLGDLHRK